MLLKKRRLSTDIVVFQVISMLIVTFVTLLCLVPFIMVISASFSDEASIYKYGYRLLPRVFSLEAYKTIFQAPQNILNAYKISIMLTVFGTLLGLFLTSMAAYVLQKKEFRYRNHISFIFYFTSIFGGGMVPFYLLMTRYLQLKDTFWAMFIPPLITAWNIVLLRNFFKTVPGSIAESAKIDGASEFIIFLRLYLPISKPGLATVGLFLGLSYWNNWWLAMIFIENKELYPLQYVLYNMMNSFKFAEVIAKEAGIPMPRLPQQSFKMAMAVVTTGPIILFYPYLQKYMIKGLTIGSIKG